MADLFLYIECGTVMTRALVVDIKDQIGIVACGEALTTAGYSGDDLSLGVLDAVSQAEAALGRPLVEQSLPLKIHAGSGLSGIIVTSSVAGAAVAAVAGVFRDISAESAQRAVLLGGGSVSDVFAVNDNRLPHEKRVALKQRPIDMLILAGGVDDFDATKTPGTQAVGVARLLAGGLPRSRSNPTDRPTVVYAGSVQVREEIEGIFSGVAPLAITENVRPTLEAENLEPARVTVLEHFQRVTAASGRYSNLGVRVTPSGYATVRALEELTKHYPENTMIVDQGGAYTTVCSSIDGVLNRTVFDLNTPALNGSSLGVRSDEAAKWLPFASGRVNMSTALGNRLVRPEALPETWEDIAVKMALAREEARVGLEHHKRLAVTLRGIQRKRQIWEILGAYQSVGGQTLVDLTKIKNIILTGGWQKGLTPAQIMLVAMEGLQTAGINRLYRDSDSIMALLGSLIDLSLIPARTIIESMRPLGTCVAPIESKGQGGVNLFGSSTSVTVDTGGRRQTLRLPGGKITRVPLESGKTAVITVTPPPGIDYGDGPGKRVQAEVTGGDVGLVFDTRPRPLSIPLAEDRRRARLLEWWEPLQPFPPEIVAGWQGGQRQ